MVAFLGAYNSLFLAPEVSEEKLVTEKVTTHLSRRRTHPLPSGSQGQMA